MIMKLMMILLKNPYKFIQEKIQPKFSCPLGCIKKKEPVIDLQILKKKTYNKNILKRHTIKSLSETNIMKNYNFLKNFD
jgi:hypothetical protein